jgi:hypothetical protein
MAPLALAIQLALASPGLVPPLDPGPFQGSELAASSAGVFIGDALVLGAGYATLQLFANDSIDPSATNFRRAAYGLSAAALITPPIVAALLARWARVEPASGSTWKALLLATLGHVGALAVGVAASPHFWVILPVQLLAVGVGTTVGLHWGPRERRAPAAGPAMGSQPPDPPPGREAALCPDPARAAPRAHAAGGEPTARLALQLAGG